jgi:hypothetical protein
VLDAGENEGLDQFNFDDPANPAGLSPLNLSGLAPAPNCHFTSDQDMDVNWYCAYMGEPGDQWLAELDQPFMSDGNCQLS